MFDIIFIGKGIGSLVLAYEWRKKFPECKIAFISADKFSPVCSRSSTSVVSLSGIEKGVSKLGDLLVDSYDNFEKFYCENESEFDFILKADEYILNEIEEKNDYYKKRFGSGEDHLTYSNWSKYCQKKECYLIENFQLLNWLEKKIKIDQVFHDFVLDVEITKNSYKCIGRKKNYEAKNVITCKGVLEKNVKKVCGSYLYFEDVDWEVESLNIKSHGRNLIYRKPFKQLLINSDEIVYDKMIYSHNYASLEKNYNYFKNDVLKKLVFPDLNRAKLITGMRAKGQKRLPRLNKTSQSFGDMWQLSGLYKNGFSFPHYFSKQLFKNY